MCDAIVGGGGGVWQVLEEGRMWCVCVMGGGGGEVVGWGSGGVLHNHE